ncbi:MAG: antibiotic biosynthesis monooxygenase [Alphaproteobacteria bacterium]|nr:antibiotic biosynthesis monooxygenase [Alphaproteobacteria bacterium]
MIAVIFEVWPKDGHLDDYLDIAHGLRPELEKIDGFISIERFSSMYEDGKLLSLSIWRDEDAVKAWREQLDHRAAQARGRDELFANYRLRVAEILRDYGPTERDQAPT